MALKRRPHLMGLLRRKAEKVEEKKSKKLGPGKKKSEGERMKIQAEPSVLKVTRTHFKTFSRGI